METGLEGKPWYYGAGIAVVLAGALVAAGYYVMFKDMQRNIVRKETELADFEQKITEGRAAERQLPQFLEEVERLELELDKLLRILPPRRKTEDILRRVRALTEQGDFRLIQFDPADPQPLDDFYSEWGISIVLDGTYHNLALFFDRISRFSRIVNIENLRISPVRDVGGRHTIQANFVARTFLSNETEEEP